MTERERIRQVYEQRKQKIPSDLYSFFNRANLFIIQGRERAILEAFKRSGIHSHETRRILDIGYGGGGLGISSDTGQVQKIYSVSTFCQTESEWQRR